MNHTITLKNINPCLGCCPFQAHNGTSENVMNPLIFLQFQQVEIMTKTRLSCNAYSECVAVLTHLWNVFHHKHFGTFFTCIMHVLMCYYASCFMCVIFGPYPLFMCCFGHLPPTICIITSYYEDNTSILIMKTLDKKQTSHMLDIRLFTFYFHIQSSAQVLPIIVNHIPKANCKKM